MPSNINDFDKSLSIFAQVKVPDDHSNMVKKVAMQALSGVVNKTPVDTGRARSNWMTAVNTVPSDTIELSANLSREQAAAESINRGVSVIDEAKPFSSISIANNLPYIGVLEYGGSNQAPEGMVRTTLAEIEAAFKMSYDTQRNAIQTRFKTLWQASYPTIPIVYDNLRAEKAPDGYVALSILNGASALRGMGAQRLSAIPVSSAWMFLSPLKKAQNFSTNMLTRLKAYLERKVLTASFAVPSIGGI